MAIKLTDLIKEAVEESVFDFLKSKKKQPDAVKLDPIILDPKNPINSKPIADPKRGSEIKIGTALKNPERYSHLMPAIKAIVDKDPNGEKWAAQVVQRKKSWAKYKSDRDKVAKTASARGGEKSSNNSTRSLSRKSNTDTSDGGSSNFMARNNLSNFDKYLSNTSNYYNDRSSNSSDFGGFGGGSSGGGGASGDW